jgi:hypothetical protein
MLEDGIKEKGQQETLAVSDLSELVEQSIEPPAKKLRRDLL